MPAEGPVFWPADLWYNQIMIYDVAIIGAGPAGLIAAGRAGELGARVIVIEKNKQVGIKLLLTGGGRCNLTNAINEPRKLAEAYGAEGKFLISAFTKFGSEQTIEFFERKGVKTKTEANGRVFPASNQAQTVLDALLKYLKESKVELKTLDEVREFVVEDDKINKVILASGDTVMAKNFIIATGGKSYFMTGSNGDGYKWLKKLGHKVAEPYPALTPIFVKEKFVAELQGLSLPDVQINLYSENKKIIAKRGELLFTSFGLSGPLALDLSRTIARELPDKVEVKIDFQPDKNFDALDETLLTCFRDNNNKLIKNSLGQFMPAKLVPIALRLSKIDAEKKVNLVTKDERKALIKSLKEFGFVVDSLGGYKFAMVTSGGPDLREIDQKTMKSKLIDNLYVVGELLGIDGPTGGYNLQVCWSSGYVAGENSANNS